MKKPNIDKVKARLRTKGKPQTAPKAADYVSTDLDLLDLACTGKVGRGLRKGYHYLFVGDSGAGKTWLLQQIFASIANNPAFDDYRIIDDNPERGALMDRGRFFGRKLVQKSEPPSSHGASDTLEDFYDNVWEACADGRPFAYGLDSEDALPAEAAIERADDNRKARRKLREGKKADIKKSYGDKAKINSERQGIAHQMLGKSGSILIIIKQTRDNIGPDAMFNPKTRSGGRALTFFATLEFWFSIKGRLKKTVNERDRVIGTILRIHVKKNRVAGREWHVDVHFYPTVGFDNTGSNVAWLVEEKHWKKSQAGIIEAKELGLSGTLEKLVREIEDKGLERDLRLVVAETWKEIEEACTVTRKRRYE